jgi:hypothetical protein
MSEWDEGNRHVFNFMNVSREYRRENIENEISILAPEKLIVNCELLQILWTETACGPAALLWTSDLSKEFFLYFLVCLLVLVL